MSKILWSPVLAGYNIASWPAGRKNLLLRKAFEKVESPLSKAENARHLAIANARLGNRDQADKYLKLARQLDSQCRLIERAEAELEHQINRL